MKLLPTEIRQNGFEYKQLAREQDVALYSQTPVGQNEGRTNYEVIHVRKYPTYEIAGVEILAHEAFPPNESWGEEGFTATDRDAAFRRFQEELKRQPESPVTGQAKGGVKGRKRLDIAIQIPDGEFTMNDIVKTHPAASAALLQNRVRDMVGKTIKLVEKRKSASGRGKPQNIYSRI